VRYAYVPYLVALFAFGDAHSSKWPEVRSLPFARIKKARTSGAGKNTNDKN